MITLTIRELLEFVEDQPDLNVDSPLVVIDPQRDGHEPPYGVFMVELGYDLSVTVARHTTRPAILLRVREDRDEELVR